jgi:hypothetical protein
VVVRERKVLLSFHPVRMGIRYDFECECS